MSELLAYILAHEESFRRARLPSLYSDFSTQRNTNPDGYATNVAAWQRALAHAALAGVIDSSSPGSRHHGEEGTAARGDLLVLRTGNALMAELETQEWGRPVALQTTIDEAIRCNSMIPLDAFQTSSTSPFKTSWIRLPPPPTISQVMGWSMKQLRAFLSDSEGHSGGSGNLQVMNLVLVDNLKEVGKRIVATASSSHRSNTDLIYSKELFTKRFANIGGGAVLSNLDVDVLLTFLSRDENAILYDGETVKFKSAKNNVNSITHEDRTIASLKTLISNLIGQVALLESKIKESSLRAKDAVTNKNRVVALSALRSKKMAENNLKQRTDTLLQLEEVYMKLEQAADQIDIVRVMEASAGALRSLHAQVGGVERVEDVLEELREEMSKVDEVGNIINEAGEAVDEDELDDELASMEKQEREARDAEEAEATQRKLAELERFEKSAIEAEARRKAEKENATVVDYDSELDDSIGKLSNMSIEDRENTEAQKAEQVIAE
ncbi:SNF7 family protein [Blastomyces dermatitidis ATCC 18188]|uniref:SNF7 family protein n=1 Tax=Ajellomyces dermatitidis (strain ATCC 18188 / CBS 674.68) TaxID=653446 RepID=F2TDG9_AJEDA|nr:SNF7 family protein [Blastomyces dermatitidis ATCC 18188]